MSLTIKIIIGVFIATIIGLVTMQFIAPSQQVIESISRSFDSDDLREKSKQKVRIL